ncbi:ESF1 homolog [Hypanus sabinus]|uniref:ESF1 homolog n=1 Tax=Hypanus sabinus TaxID=79690 RepID=UPI0028C4A3B6|nr:ESF1 homolog [Hypanus sabinus]XP_059842180.1 ESF1 homolog [Hypanus sabinus]XP_059842181.1 ESF1 homolog [Hypanus sabinus]
MASRAEEVMNDERFSRVMKDPRFWEMPEKERKVKIDKRFQGMFHEKKFKLNYTVDKRGRPIHHSTTEDLKRFYDLDSDDSDLVEDECTENKRKEVGKKMKKRKSGFNKNLEGSIMVNKEEKTKLLKGTKLKKVKKPGTEMPNDNVKIDFNKEKLKTIASEETELKDDLSESSEEMEQPKNESISSFKLLKKKITRNQKGIKPEKSSMKKCVSEDDTELESDTYEDDIDDEGQWSGSESSRSGGLSSEKESEITAGSEDEEELSEEDTDSDSGPDLARGKGNIETSSEEDDYFDDDPLANEPEIEHNWGELDKEAPRENKVTRRFAVCNMDWDKIKANDLVVLFNSFIPKGGAVLSVKIYPSEYGKEKMKEEELHGPVELLSNNLPENADEDTREQRIIREKVREYQFKRLKYYYAVVECDSPETANKLYEECDGMEYESSSSFLDLRFIPDELTFEDEPKDVAADVNLAEYKPKYFTSTALGSSKAQLTWEETDHERVATLTRRFNKDEIKEMDFNAYLASSSEEDDDTDIKEEEESQPDKDVRSTLESKMAVKTKKVDEQISKYRELLKTVQRKEEKNKDMEMEITWVPGLKETTEAMVKKKLENQNKLTPWEQYLEKRKDKKREKRKKKNKVEDLEVKNTDELSEDEIPSDVDLNDPFFAEELEQSAPQQKTVNKKVQRSRNKPLTAEEEASLEKEKAEMALLLMDDEDEERKHFNYDKIVEQQNLSKKKKKKLDKKQELIEKDNFQVDVADSRFQAIYTSHLFNLDPSDPNFKKTNATQSFLQEKSRQRQEQQKKAASLARESDITGEETVTIRKPVDHGLSLLIKSVKSKTEQFQARKKQKTV